MDRSMNVLFLVAWASWYTPTMSRSRRANGRTAGIADGRARVITTEAAIAAPVQGCVPKQGRADN